MGSDINRLGEKLDAMDFNPRSPCGERQNEFKGQASNLEISIHAPRVGSDAWDMDLLAEELGISIHAPRVGSDLPPAGKRWGKNHFNPRSPCGERLAYSYAPNSFLGFQSTLPVWGATFE